MKTLEEIQACSEMFESVADLGRLGRIREQIENAESPEELFQEAGEKDYTDFWLTLKIMELEAKAKTIKRSNMSGRDKLTLIIDLIQDVRWWVSAGEISDHECGQRFQDARMMNSWQRAWVEEGVELANKCGSATQAARQMFERHERDAEQPYPNTAALREAIRRHPNRIAYCSESKKKYP